MKTPDLEQIDLGYYALDGHDVIKLDSGDTLGWAELFEKVDGRVAQTMVHNVMISTVFLGLDHNHMRMMPGLDSTPILFESMVFGGALDGEQWRYATWAEAVEGHWELYWHVRRAGSRERPKRIGRRAYRKAIAEGRA